MRRATLTWSFSTKGPATLRQCGMSTAAAPAREACRHNETYPNLTGRPPRQRASSGLAGKPPCVRTSPYVAERGHRKTAQCQRAPEDWNLMMRALSSHQKAGGATPRLSEPVRRLKENSANIGRNRQKALLLREPLPQSKRPSEQPANGAGPDNPRTPVWPNQGP